MIIQNRAVQIMKLNVKTTPAYSGIIFVIHLLLNAVLMATGGSEDTLEVLDRNNSSLGGLRDGFDLKVSILGGSNIVIEEELDNERVQHRNDTLNNELEEWTSKLEGDRKLESLIRMLKLDRSSMDPPKRSASTASWIPSKTTTARPTYDQIPRPILLKENGTFPNAYMGQQLEGETSL